MKQGYILIMDIKNNLKNIRKSRGLTQEELAKKSGLTQRVIAYYENETERISSTPLIELAKALEVSTDEILGLKQISSNLQLQINESKLLKKLKKVMQLERRDQYAVFQLINSLQTKSKLKNKRLTK